MGDVWEGYREAQQERRAKRLPGRQEEIRALAGKGFTVRELTPYQFRIDERLDLYPIHRRWHDTKTGKRGNYQNVMSVAVRILRTPKE